jgi:hypothetical protein
MPDMAGAEAVVTEYFAALGRRDVDEQRLSTAFDAATRMARRAAARNELERVATA